MSCYANHLCATCLSCFVKVFYELTIGLVVDAVAWYWLLFSTRQFRVPKCQNGANIDDVIVLTLTLLLTKSIETVTVSS
jgi:hypothetical protein